MSPPCGAKITPHKTEPKFSSNFNNNFEDHRSENQDYDVDDNDEGESYLNNESESESESDIERKTMETEDNGNGRKFESFRNTDDYNSGGGSSSNSGNGNSGGTRKTRYSPTLFPTRTVRTPPPSMYPTQNPSSPITPPVPIFTATVTEHASDKNDPYILATEPLVFPLNPRGTYVLTDLFVLCG